MADRYTIVVDGTACLNKEIEREFDIRWLPLHVDIGKVGERLPDVGGESIGPEPAQGLILFNASSIFAVGETTE